MANESSGKKNDYRHFIEELISILYRNFIIFITFFIFLAIGLVEPSYFFSWDAFTNIMVYLTGLGVLAFGIAFTIVVGEIDLSIIGVMGITAYFAWLMNKFGFPTLIVISLSILVGTAIGFTNGYLTQVVRIPSLIETISVMFMLYGVILVATGGTSLGGFASDYLWIGTATIFGSFRVLILTLIVMSLITYYILHQSTLGKRFFLVGGDPKAARLLGLNVARNKMMAFILSGTYAGIAGYLVSSRLGVITTHFGRELLMPAIAAPIIGGVSIFGGEGNFLGILCGSLMIQIIATGLVAVGVSGWYTDIVTGALILLAMTVDSIRRHRSKAEES